MMAADAMFKPCWPPPIGPTKHSPMSNGSSQQPMYETTIPTAPLSFGSLRAGTNSRAAKRFCGEEAVEELLYGSRLNGLNGLNVLVSPELRDAQVTEALRVSRRDDT